MAIGQTLEDYNGNPQRTGRQLRSIMLNWGGVLNTILMELLDCNELEPHERASILHAMSISLDDVLEMFVRHRLKDLDPTERSTALCDFGGTIVQLGLGDHHWCVVSIATKVGLSNEDAQTLITCMLPDSK